jgi:hypothetical protein
MGVYGSGIASNCRELSLCIKMGMRGALVTRLHAAPLGHVHSFRICSASRFQQISAFALQNCRIELKVMSAIFGNALIRSSKLVTDKVGVKIQVLGKCVDLIPCKRLNKTN